MVKYCRACKYYIPEDADKCAHCGADQRRSLWRWLTLGNLGILFTIVMAVSIAFQSIYIGKQTDSIEKQTAITKNSFEVGNRPYLFVNIGPAQPGYDKDKNLFAGTIVTYKNAGLFTASAIEMEAKIADDGDDRQLFDIIQWYKDTHGSYPYVNNVFPEQIIPPLKFTPNISDFPDTNEKYIYFGIRIKYKGFTQDAYCYGADYVYKLIKNINNDQEPFSVLVLKYDTYWDLGRELLMPDIKAPDWNIYKKSKLIQ